MKSYFITVRTGSSRLPNKSTKQISGKATIEYLINNIKNSSATDNIILCTTTEDRDDVLCEIAADNDIRFFRGPTDDKLLRWHQACEAYDIDFFVNVDGDDILFDVELGDLCFRQMENSDADFIDGRGLYNDVYGISRNAIEVAVKHKTTTDTEFVKTFFDNVSEYIKFEKINNIPLKFTKKDVRLTLDYQEDFDFFETVFKKLQSQNKDITYSNAMALLEEQPELKKINWCKEASWVENQNKMTSKKPSKFLGNELEYIQRVLNAESWSSTAGSWCHKLEQDFCASVGAEYAVAMNSGTSTLHAALEAVGVGYGDEVISPAITVIMDSTATFHANAIPVYADVCENTFNIDPDDIERKITDKTKAIIAVSLYGLPCEMDRIMEISDKYDIPVIEDNAQCFTSKYKGRYAGTIGHISSWSFENSKHITCGEGGIITTNNEQYAEMCRKIGGHGYKNLRAREGQIKLNQSVFQDPDYKRHDTVGWNYRLSEILAAVTVAQLENIDQKVQQRVEVASMFIDVMNESDIFRQQEVADYCDHSYFTLGVLYDGLEKAGIPWKQFREKYVSFGGDGFYGAWSVPYLEPLIADRAFVKRCPDIYGDLKYEAGLCPVAERIQPKLMQFKTNYRDIDTAREKAEALRKTIDFYGVTK
mgnify:FL=1